VVSTQHTAAAAVARSHRRPGSHPGTREEQRGVAEQGQGAPQDAGRAEDPEEV